ncbi:MAG: hypothetical protein ACRDOF_00280 [Gaiellaceae bacterium]
MTGIDDPPTNRSRTRYWQPAPLIVAPAVLFAALVVHPYIGGRLPNDESVARAVVDAPTRWAVAHLGASVASALMILAFLAVRSYLHRAGEDRLSTVGMPFVIVGSTLFAVLPGMEFVPFAVAETGGTVDEVAAAQDAITGWFAAVLVVGGILFAIGVFSFARAISIASVGSRELTRIVVIALVSMAISRFVPFAAVQFYVQGVAAIVALWLLAYVVWTRPVPSTAGAA